MLWLVSYLYYSVTIVIQMLMFIVEGDPYELSHSPDIHVISTRPKQRVASTPPTSAVRAQATVKDTKATPVSCRSVYLNGSFSYDSLLYIQYMYADSAAWLVSSLAHCVGERVGVGGRVWGRGS